MRTKLRPPTAIARDLGARWQRQLDTRGGIDWYRREYANGWKASLTGADSAKYNSGCYSFAWEDGYLDAAAGRPRWHLAHCPDHDACGEG